MHFTCRSFIGKSAQGSWSQYWENEPDDSSLIQTRGHLFGLINLRSDSDVSDISPVGHDIIFEINQNYFSSENNDSIDDCLKNAILSVVNNPLYKSKELELLIAIVSQNNIHFASYGPTDVVFCRGDRISLLLENDSSNIKNISGPLLPEDKIFITTSSFFEKITWEKIKSVLAGEKIQNIEENFLSLLYSFDDQTNLAAALIQSHADEETVDQISADTALEAESEPFTPPSDNPLISNKFTPVNIFSFFEKLTNRKPVYVSHHDIKQVNRRKKINFVIAILLIAGITISSYFGYQKNKSSKAEKEYLSLKTQLDDKFANIAAIKNVDINSAKQIAEDSEKIVQKMVKLNIHSDDVTRYQSQIQQVLNQTGASNHYSPDLFYDTSISIKNAQYSKILISNNQLFLLDNINGRIDTIDLLKKSTKNFSSSDKLKNITIITDNKDDIYAAGNDAIYLIKSNSLESKVSLSTQSKPITASDFHFWNGAIYILDAKNLTIWKTAPNATGFGAPQNWIKNDQKLSSDVNSFAINGKIWVLSQNGVVAPYSSGIKDSFTLAQQEQITNAKNMKVTIDLDYIAFTNNDNLIYIYKKSGELKSKYNLDQLKINDIAFDEKNGFIYILGADQKIYRQSF